MQDLGAALGWFFPHRPRILMCLFKLELIRHCRLRLFLGLLDIQPDPHPHHEDYDDKHKPPSMREYIAEILRLRLDPTPIP